MPEYLKQGWPEKVERSTEVAETVSRVLSDVEHVGLPAVRRYSQQLDQWDPDSFVVPADQVAKSAAEVGDELAAHLEFARSQVERFATEQRARPTCSGRPSTGSTARRCCAAAQLRLAVHRAGVDRGAELMYGHALTARLRLESQG